MTEERYELAVGRIREMIGETSVEERFRDYFDRTAAFLLLVDEVKEALEKGSYQKASLVELKEWNHRMYEDILPEHYDSSYGNPAYACACLGEDYGQALGFLYGELRGALAYVFEGRVEYLDILMELFLEVYNQF